MGKEKRVFRELILIHLQPRLLIRRVKAWQSFSMPLCLSMYHTRCRPLAGTSPRWRDLYAECARRSRSYKIKLRISAHHITGGNFTHTNNTPQRALRVARTDYINEILTENPEENDTRPFFWYVKSQCLENCGVAPFKFYGQLHPDGGKKAEIFNKKILQFSPVTKRMFTRKLHWADQALRRLTRS